MILTKRITIIFLATVIFFNPLSAQSNVVGIIDFYGNEKITEEKLRRTIHISEGDTIDPLIKDSLIQKLKSLPGVHEADFEVVCCEGSKGQAILYIGINEIRSSASPYNPPPLSSILLPDSVVNAYSKYMEVFVEGIEKGVSGEDRSQGHSLADYAPARALQLKFIPYANRNLTLLREVLKNSSNAEHRAIAAQIIAYTDNKAAIVDDLLYAINDEDEGVRNNSTRAIALIAAYGENNPQLKIKEIPAYPFINMMNSVVWTDRNKGAAVLLALTEKRDSLVMKKIKEQGLRSVTEMAKWKNRGHAMMGYLLLGRITGYTDEEIFNAFNSDAKNTFLEEMQRKATLN